MNRLSSTLIFTRLNESANNKLVESITKMNSNIKEYMVPYDFYEHLIKGMRTYRYSMSRLVVKSAESKEIRPILLQDPLNKNTKPIILPTPLNVLGNGTNSFADTSLVAKFTRDHDKRATAFDVNEIDLYTLLFGAFLDLNLTKYSNGLKRNNNFILQLALAYARMFTRCIDKTYPISGKDDGSYAISIYLAGVYAISTFFEMKPTEASSILLSKGIVDRNIVQSKCKAFRSNKLEFKNIEEFLELYNEEFSHIIKKGDLKLRTFVSMYQKMFGANSFFAIEHGSSFLRMILSPSIGLYNDRMIDKSTVGPKDKIEEILSQAFAKFY